MVAKTTSSFSLNFEVQNVVDDWVFGIFFVVIDGTHVGNQADNSVDMKGCLRWWLDLAGNPRNRYEVGLYEEKKEKVYSLLAAAVLVEDDKERAIPEFYEESFARFHISHVGMSSFDKVTMIFLKNEAGLERIIWKASDEEVHDAYFAANELERIFADGAVVLEKSICEQPKGPPISRPVSSE